VGRWVSGGGKPSVLRPSAYRQVLREFPHGKGNASRGLWHGAAAALISLGFEQQVNVDQCLFIHKTRDIDLAAILMSNSIGSRK